MDTLEFELTREDIRDAMEAHYRSRPGSWAIRVISLALLAMGSLQLVSGDLLWGTVIFATGMFYPMASTRLAASVIARRKAAPQGRVRLDFTDDGIAVEGAEHSGTIRQLERIAVGRKSILLYVDRVHYLVIPRRIFSDREQFRSIIRQARQRLHGNGHVPDA